MALYSRERPFPCGKHPEATVPLLLGHPDRDVCVQCWLELGAAMKLAETFYPPSAQAGQGQEGKVPASPAESETGNE